ncbi:trehalose phosphate synthase [Selaginella moellendorffii]|uniref:alpha,alpha-trehalose-phosphate synthase (UDP-forming) n=1 Tax=Selaginella moellendorffii TaxID=88036 RepID=D8T0H9_SELML|nr:alpha,alpha-trehalose-phosphate synthase [UDP-forming] 5 [Selaginella moellendorffii]EFJ09908.1 trehalose phosphate synthase [Selaginella moellendorffii]|eukprot:XP_002989114.1 alpha,alpha-trehalose-phosphate synthase [UDP-forming] 5 [Selaginella moellendorffii]
MVSRSYSNLLDLSSPAEGTASPRGRRLPRVMTVAGLCSDSRIIEDDSASEAASISHSSRVIIVAHQLPLHGERRPDNLLWNFRWDDDSLLLQLKDGLPEELEVVYVGCLRVDVPMSEQDEVAAILLRDFNCVPAFLPPDLHGRFYHGFCKQQLWPLFHYMLPLTTDPGGRFDRLLWQAYVSANKIFADKVMEVISPEEDFVWLHDYHLMVLPTFLRKRFNRIKLGFFLHSPFPSSEIYRTLPVREQILRALLNADLIGFHTFDYARHFLSCCSRMLGLEFESRRGYIGLEYYGRTVGIKIMPVGIHMSQLEAGLKLQQTNGRVEELSVQFAGKIVLLGMDDMDIFKGIGLKFLAMEELLNQHPEYRGKLVLVQIGNPARGRGKDVLEVQHEAYAVAKRVNQAYGREGYQPVVLIERDMPLYERIAYYTIAECCIVTAVRDGMNLIPYEYIVCRQGMGEEGDEHEADDGLGRIGVITVEDSDKPKKKSMLVVSEFIGCSPSLSGAIRVNPWNIEAVAEAMIMAVSMPEAEKHARHEKHFKYVSSHDVAYWAQSFMADLERACRDHSRRRSYGIGFGLGFRVVALDPNFRRLMTEHLVSVYRRSSCRAILLDYDGTMMPQTSVNKTPSPEVISILNTLCSNPKNVVFIVSGRDRQILHKWFSQCDKLGLAAEHGYFYRWSRDEDWQACVPVPDFEWKHVALPVMRQYMDSTDGSYIEAKESALVWHHRDADPDFGSWQAKELLDHLESVLANDPVSVKSGQFIVEVKPQGVSKGVVVERLLSSLAQTGKSPDFVLCIGDDRSDEDMFEKLGHAISSSSAEVFACTVGQKPSKARYYLDDTVDVIKMLEAVATASESSLSSPMLGGGGGGGHGFDSPSPLLTFASSMENALTM